MCMYVYIVRVWGLECGCSWESLGFSLGVSFLRYCPHCFRQDVSLAWNLACGQDWLTSKSPISTFLGLEFHVCIITVDFLCGTT